MSRTGSVVIMLGLLCGSALADTQPADPAPDRFAAEIAAFAAWDEKNSFPEDAILFVGSSSIRLWATTTAFPDLPIINRGFGGSHMSDVNHYYSQVVKPYAPATIVVYAGDNDIADGKTPKRVCNDFISFVQLVRADSDRTRILFISVKPSIDRWEFWPAMVATNRLIQDYVADKPGIDYVDLASPLLDAAGQPKDVYIADQLHLNEDGYRLWNAALALFLNP